MCELFTLQKPEFKQFAYQYGMNESTHFLFGLGLHLQDNSYEVISRLDKKNPLPPTSFNDITVP